MDASHSSFIVSETTVCLKVALLTSGWVATRVAFTSPNPAPKAKEQGRFGTKDPGSLIGQLLRIAMMPLVTAFPGIEVVLLLVGQFSGLLPFTFGSMIDSSAIRLANLHISQQYLLGWTFIVFGALIRVGCFRTLGRFFTFELSVKDDHKLITSGPYAIVRHPSYTGTLLVASGSLLCALAPGSWFVECSVGATLIGKVMAAVYCVGWGFFFISVPLRIKKEDEVFRKQFGAEWEAWAKQTRYKLVPLIY